MPPLRKYGRDKERVRLDHAHYIRGGKVECTGPGFDKCKAAQQRQEEIDAQRNSKDTD